MSEKFEFWIVYGFLKSTKFLPKSFVYFILKAISLGFFHLEKRRSKVTLKNLSLAFPNNTTKQNINIAKKAYESIAITIAEILLLFNNRLDIDSVITNKEEALEKLYKHSKLHQQGMIFLTAHFSNWELLAHFLAKHGYPMIAIGRKGNNSFIENNITTPFREKYGNKNVHKSNAILALIRALKANKNVGLLIDQKAGGQNSIKAAFFGHEADTINSVALMKNKYDTCIQPAFIIRQENGKYTIKVSDPVEYMGEADASDELKIIQMTQRYNDILEEVIKEHPQQWFWMHNRWRLPR